MKKSVYLDSTIISYLVDERNEIHNFIDITKNWWSTQRKFYLLYLSLETIAELEAGNYPNKDKALNFASKVDILPRDREIELIAEFYIENALMPRNIMGDAVHLAYASFYKIDFLMTWNCKHLANANKKPHIRAINTKLGLFIPEIITPLELYKEDNDA